MNMRQNMIEGVMVFKNLVVKCEQKLNSIVLV